VQCLADYNDRLKEQYEKADKLAADNESLRQRIRDLEAQISQLGKQNLEGQSLLKKEQDKVKRFQELEKILADLKAQRDLLLKQLEQAGKEKELVLKRYEELREEVQRLLLRVREESVKYYEELQRANGELVAKDEELAKKDAVIKNLTQRQLEMNDQV